jgi:hypothetical protein
MQHVTRQQAIRASAYKTCKIGPRLSPLAYLITGRGQAAIWLSSTFHVPFRAISRQLLYACMYFRISSDPAVASGCSKTQDTPAADWAESFTRGAFPRLWGRQVWGRPSLMVQMLSDAANVAADPTRETIPVVPSLRFADRRKIHEY